MRRSKRYSLRIRTRLQVLHVPPWLSRSEDSSDCKSHASQKLREHTHADVGRETGGEFGRYVWVLRVRCRGCEKGDGAVDASNED
jgi:hypothetical protein